MSQRQIALDTETTGLRTEEGHRIIEIAGIELVNRKFTGRRVHYYLNPEREIDAGAAAIHGITTAFLADKPRFTEIADELLSFIEQAELIIHNAPFDVGFLNYELSLLGLSKTITHYCRIVDTLPLARRLHAGQKNSLDALCKRYGVDNSKRDLHGALLDANLLAEVYLRMTGGQGSFLDQLTQPATKTVISSDATPINSQIAVALPPEAANLQVLKADEVEIDLHQQYLAAMGLAEERRW